MNVNTIYVKGKLSDFKEVSWPKVITKKRLRNKVNKILREFLDSDKHHMEIEFDKDVVPHQVFKSYINMKNFLNGWDQYVIVTFNGWPDLVGKFVKSFQGESEGVMLNEVLSENYDSTNVEYIPMGYTLNKGK